MSDDATQAQIKAATPTASSWVSANAGSGKTRVLTNRVARILLSGAPPEKILCLTYTKAAAAEMQNRLIEQLGKWAMMDDEALTKDLKALGEEEAALEDLNRARTLFALALETPGGLKIQTIHSFCDTILHRFPQEAGVSPLFQALDDYKAAEIQREIVEEIAQSQSESRDALDAVAEIAVGEDLSKIIAALLKHQDLIESGVNSAQIARSLEVDKTISAQSLADAVFTPSRIEALKELTPLMQKSGGNDEKYWAPMPEALENTSAERKLYLAAQAVLTTKGTARAKFPSKRVTDHSPDLEAWYPDFVEAVIAALDKVKALKLVETTDVFLRFGRLFLKHYTARKQSLGALDFDDMIRKTRNLLKKDHAAAWVLYRLDGGIDHILVDEAQDTSPEQWDVIEALTGDFFSGDTARSDIPRTLFVVGDEKQSIYSFQGADPDAFGAMHAQFKTRLYQAGHRLNEGQMRYSFRSSPAILDVVDAVFINEMKNGVQNEVSHIAFKSELAGRVELWPYLERSDASDLKPWFEPLDMPSDTDPNIILARNIAAWCHEQLSQNKTLPGKAQPIKASDIMILVQRRSRLFHALIAELKRASVPVAGADRMELTESLAVKDLLSLLRWADLPEDDLSLAEVLRSPLCGLDEKALFDLAYGRGKQFLWQVLRKEENRKRFPKALALLDYVLSVSDKARPYDLLETILTRFEGRKNLLARLGFDAEDGIDELLVQAMLYETLEPPSLSGFNQRLRQTGVEIKRELNAQSDQVRVMTVHGAKGLEAPIVILPDTAHRQNRGSRSPVSKDENALYFTASNSEPPHYVKSLKQEALDQEIRENNRLLYVALTRAENWLIVAGAGKPRKENERSWYNAVESGLTHLNALKEPCPVGDALTYSHKWKLTALEEEAPKDSAKREIPEWIHKKAAPITRMALPISPSELGGAHALPGEATDRDALAYGRFVHKLFEILPEQAPEDQVKTISHIQKGFPTLSEAEITEAVAEVRAALTASELAPLFKRPALTEVPITTTLPLIEAKRMTGIIDRVIFDGDIVHILDYKTHQSLPSHPEETPEAILRQMAAYRHALKAIYPTQKIIASILWTHQAKLMTLEDRLLDQTLAKLSKLPLETAQNPA